MPFDYRTDFNYPWSQAPCVMPVAAHHPSGPVLLEPGGVAPEPEEIITPPAARRPTRSAVTVRRSDVLVSDMGRPPARYR
jgi:hypothetical protein